MLLETERSSTPDSFRIVPATWRDLTELRQLERVCFPKDAWPLLDLIGVLSLPGVVRLKAITAGQMVGFIAGDVRKSNDLGWIATVGVLPEHRGRGIGEALIRACEEQMGVSVVRLNVRVSNTGAISLYKKLGYQETGTWTGYYQDGEDALVMEKVM